MLFCYKKGEMGMKLFQTKLYELLEIEPGVTALIGGGGKTSLLYHLVGELYRRGTVAIATTTHIKKPDQFPFAATEEEAKRLLAERGYVCIGTETGDGKLTAPSFAGWEHLADYVLVEADGAKMHPLKAHAAHEPVIPVGCGNVICVAGASGFQTPIVQAVHRPEVFAALAEVSEQSIATPELVAKVLEKEHLHTRVFLNQVDALHRFFGKASIKEFAKELNCPVVAGSLRQGSWQKY